MSGSVQADKALISIVAQAIFSSSKHKTADKGGRLSCRSNEDVERDWSNGLSLFSFRISGEFLPEVKQIWGYSDFR
ncbi:MAG: hypothetical protein M3512_13645 [Bacteroidota bacterium]|nr:hypothetical protein [Bacteroidota bacterium]